MSKYYPLKPGKFSVEFSDWRQASAPGGQLAVAALLDQFGLQATSDLKHWVTWHAWQWTNTPLGFVDPESHLYPKRFHRLMAAEGVALMGQPGWGSGQFNCDLVGEPGPLVVVVASSNLVNWIPLSLNTLGSVPLPFSHRQSAQFRCRFYRLLKP